MKKFEKLNYAMCLKHFIWLKRTTEKYVAEATGGHATGVDTEPDVVVENYNPNYLNAIGNNCYPKDESYHLSSDQ